MKFLILLAVIGVVLWLLKGRSRVQGPDSTGAPKPGPKPREATPMLACAHCGVHLPQTDAVLDTAGRPYCGQAHRIAGPR
jgi:uncharacterized protein